MIKKLVFAFIMVTMVFALSAPAFAVSPSTFTFQMASRMLTDIGWHQQSEELTNNGSSAVGSWFLNMPGHSYLRARFYSVDKNVGGRIEIGLNGLQPSPASACVTPMATGGSAISASWPDKQITGLAHWPTLACSMWA